MRKLWLLAIFLAVQGCGGAPISMMPGPLFATNFPPPGPPNYQQGMTDGCKTAMGAAGYAIMGLMYNKIYYDVDKALNDQVYYRAWKDAYLYCKYELDKGPVVMFNRFAIFTQAPLKLMRSSFPPHRLLGSFRWSETFLHVLQFATLSSSANTVTQENRNPSIAKGQADRRGGKLSVGQARRLSAIIFILLSLSGCKYNFITQNKPLMLEVDIDRGPPDYRAGYHDGCTSALAAYGNSYQKTLYHLERNPDYQSDKVYTQIWKDAWGYCYMWMFAYNNEKNVSNYGKPLF